MAQYPQEGVRAAREAIILGYQAEPLIPYYFAGRSLMGIATGLGPAAMGGDLLGALNKGHNALDSIILHGALGVPTRP